MKWRSIARASAVRVCFGLMGWVAHENNVGLFFMFWGLSILIDLTDESEESA